jgi:hypothetical protein
MRPPPTISGSLTAATALPVPPGDPAGIWHAADLLRAGAAGLGSPDAPWALPAGLDAGWVGPAALAARDEALLLAARTSGLGERMLRAAGVLTEYAEALDVAQRVVAALQLDYDAALCSPPDPAAASGPPGMVELAGRYVVATADLDLAGEVAAHRLRDITSGAGEGPPAAGGQPSGRGWTGRPQSDPAAAAVAGLTLTDGRQHRLSADAAAEQVAGWLGAVAAGDAWAISHAASTLELWGRDPVFAAAIWSGLPSDRLAAVVATVVAASAPGAPGAPGASGVAGVGSRPSDDGWLRDRGTALVTGLGATLAVAANPAYARGLDPLTTDRLDRERPGWLGRLAAAAGTVLTRPDGSTVGGGWVQGQLLAAASRAGLSPGASYAATVGVALVAADRAATRGTVSPLTASRAADIRADGRRGTAAAWSDDPVRSLAEALLDDAEAARAWLLHPLPEESGRFVVDHLVADRYLALPPPVAAASLGAVARLVAASGADATSRQSVLVSSAFLAAVGRTTTTTTHPMSFRRALDPALDDLGAILGAHPDAVTDTFDQSAAPGVDASGLAPADRLVRQGRSPGLWEVVLADRATASALFGALALSSSEDPAHPTPRAGPTAATPALAMAVGGMTATLEIDLLAAVATSEAGPGRPAARGPGATVLSDEATAAARRLGATTGFALASAGTALAGRSVANDAEHQALLDVAELGLAKVTVPGTAGRVATPLLRTAARRLAQAALPTGAEAAQRHATAAALESARDDAYLAVRALISQAAPWSAEHSPQAWAERTATTRHPVPFWDATGRPLPEAQLSTAQRRSFTDWRRDEGLAVYDTVPTVVLDAVEAGMRDALAVAPPPR